MTGTCSRPTGFCLGPLLAGAALLLLATSAAATPAATTFEPTGFGGAKIGTSLGEVWQMFPDAELLPEQASLGASVLDGPYIERLALRNQAVPGFAKPTTVELRFWKGKLWGVIVYFGDNDAEQVTAYLARTYGPTTSRDPDMPIWRGAKVTTTGTYKQRWYGYSDDAMGKEAGAWVNAVLKHTWPGETAEEKAERERRLAALTPRPGGATGPAARAGTSAPQ